MTLFSKIKNQKYLAPIQGKRSFSRTIGVILIFAVLSTIGCQKKTNEPIRIGVSPWPGYGILSIAKEKGYFKTQDVDVEIIHFEQAADLYKAYYEGRIDGISGTLNEMLTIRENSEKNPQVFLIADFSNGADVLLAPEGIADVNGIKGKKIGVEFSAVGVYVVARALERAGLSLDDVHLVNLKNDELPKALGTDAKNHRKVDAIVAYPPVSTEVVASGMAKAIFSSSEIPGEVVDVISMDSEIISKQREKIEGIVRAFDLAVKFLRKHPAEAKAIISKSENMSIGEIEETLSGLMLVDGCSQTQFFVPNGTLTEATKTADLVMRRINQISGPDRTVGMINFGPVQTAMANCHSSNTP